MNILQVEDDKEWFERAQIQIISAPLMVKR